MMFRSNELLLAQLERLASPSAPPREPALGVVLDRRIAQRRDPMTPMLAGATETDQFPRRRLDDLLSV